MLPRNRSMRQSWRGAKINLLQACPLKGKYYGILQVDFVHLNFLEKQVRWNALTDDLPKNRHRGFLCAMWKDMMVNLDALKIFCSVVEAGGFNRAADRLGISTTSVTNHVASLELGFRAKLLRRTTRSMSLTDEGRQCYDIAVKLLREAEELEETMHDLNAAPSGMLHVDMPTIFSNRIVAPALSQFASDYPEISVRLTANDRFVDMVDEGIDVLVRVGNLGDSRLVAQMLATTQWISCAAPDYVLRNGRPTSLEELAGLSCLNFIYPKSGRFRPWTFLRDERLITILPGGRIATDHIEGLVEAAVAGGGVIQALSISVQDEITNGLLVPLLEEFTAPGPDVNVLFQQRHLRAARVKVFVDFLHQTFAARKLG